MNDSDIGLGTRKHFISNVLTAVASRSVLPLRPTVRFECVLALDG